jgi:Ca2+-binding RTX toxin-like protein
MDLISSPSRPEVQSGANTLNFGPNIEVNEIDASSSDDDVKGDDSRDFLNGIQGNDTVRGRGGPDTVVGMDGKDELFGGSGEDIFDAGKGPDELHAVDGEKDDLMCGPGTDTVFFDQGLDVLQGCKRLRR